MLDIEWYNTNQHRYFPFTDSVVLGNGQVFPRDGVLDAGLFFGGESGYELDTHLVYLRGVRQSGSDVTLYFRATSDPLALVDLTATFDTSTAFGEMVEIHAPDGPRQAYGYVVIGDAQKISDALLGVATLVTATLSYDGGPAEVEPSRVQSQYLSVLTRLTLVEKQTTQWAPAGEDAAEEQYVVKAEDLVGNLYFNDGFNTEANIRPAENAVEIRAAVGYGQGEFCDWETVPGMPLCGQLIAAVNGVQASPDGGFTILGGRGIEVVPHDTEEAKLVVRVGRVGDLYCPEAVSEGGG